jgi:hypothetical protein
LDAAAAFAPLKSRRMDRQTEASRRKRTFRRRRATARRDQRLQSLVCTSGFAALACALACSGHENLTGPTISLSQAEVVTLADEVGDLMPTPLVDAPGPINASAACPGGGISGSACGVDVSGTR